MLISGNIGLNCSVLQGFLLAYCKKKKQKIFHGHYFLCARVGF